jgi:hypothetical protein
MDSFIEWKLIAITLSLPHGGRQEAGDGKMIFLGDLREVQRGLRVLVVRSSFESFAFSSVRTGLTGRRHSGITGLWGPVHTPICKDLNSQGRIAGVGEECNFL